MNTEFIKAFLTGLLAIGIYEILKGVTKCFFKRKHDKPKTGPKGSHSAMDFTYTAPRWTSGPTGPPIVRVIKDPAYMGTGPDILVSHHEIYQNDSLRKNKENDKIH